MAYFGKQEISEAVGSLGLPLYIDGKEVTRPLTIRHGALAGGCGCAGVDGKLAAFRDGSLGADPGRLAAFRDGSLGAYPGRLAAYRDGSLGADGLLAAYRDGSLGAVTAVLDLRDGEIMNFEFKQFLSKLMNQGTLSAERLGLPWSDTLWQNLWGTYYNNKQVPGGPDLGATVPTLMGVRQVVIEAAQRAAKEPDFLPYIKTSPLAQAVGKTLPSNTSVQYIPPGSSGAGHSGWFLYAGAAAAAVVVAALLFRGKKRR